MKKFNYIYLITNKLNGKIYIGKHSTNNLDDEYMGSGKLIKKSILKYGIENFAKEYLAFCDTEDKLNWFEKFYIKKYKARENGYNLTDGGDGSLGRKTTEETKMKISNTKSGVKVPKISKALKGRVSTFKGCHHSEETKQKLRKPKSEETKIKLSEAQKQYCKEYGNQNAGKHHTFGPMTDEHKQKLRESNKHPHKKAKWLTPSGEIITMDKSNAKRHHPDWRKIGEV